MSNQSQSSRPENVPSNAPLQPQQGQQAQGQSDPAQPDFVGDDQRDEELRTKMDASREPRGPEEISEELAEELNEDGADRISQSATGGLGNADPQINRP